MKHVGLGVARASMTTRSALGAPGVSLTANRALGGPLIATPSGARTSPAAIAPVDWGLLSDLAARAVIVVLFSMMTISFTRDFMSTGRITGLMLVVSELLVVVMTIFRRPAASVDRGIRARTLTALSMVGPPLARPAAIAALAPQLLTVGVSVIGLLIVIGGKLSLGRSFGLMPANRGIVSTGLYRIVRHPIYMGYLVTHVAFIAANPSAWNVALLVAADTALLARAVCEEGTLAQDPAYRAYQAKVRWRVCPGLF